MLTKDKLEKASFAIASDCQKIGGEDSARCLSTLCSCGISIIDSLLSTLGERIFEVSFVSQETRLSWQNFLKRSNENNSKLRDREESILDEIMDELEICLIVGMLKEDCRKYYESIL